MKRSLKTLAAVALFAGITACNQGESSDPASASRDDLNPPGSLETVTGDASLTLYWTAANVEEEFRGYYIFAAEESTVSGTYSYPNGADVSVSGIPRCELNTDFFQKFGLGITDRECEGETEDEETTDDPAFRLADEEGSESSITVEEKLKNWIPCTGDDANENLSLKVSAPVLSTKSCTISQYYNGTELADMENGTTYMFFVVAVMGDDLSEISWTSPLVTDTPSQDIISQQDITVAENKYVKITFDNSSDPWTAEVSDQAACDQSKACEYSSTNAESVSAPTIFIARQVGGDHHQRLLISGSSEGSVKIQPRGPQTALGDEKVTRILGDEASSAYPDAGTKYVIYENQIFDFEITDGSDKYYGKVHIDSVGYEDDSKTGDATVKIAVVLQPKAGETQYLSFQ